MGVFWKSVGGVVLVLAVLYAVPWVVPLPERTTEPIIPPFPAAYGAAAIADLERAEALYREGDFAAAYALWEPLATPPPDGPPGSLGNPEAQFRIGRLYDRAELFDQDNEAAKLWYGRAADQDHALAITNLGAFSFEEGKGDCTSEFTAAYRRASQLGEYIAQYNMAVDYFKEICEPYSLEGYFNWMKKSADQGYHPAHFSLIFEVGNRNEGYFDPTQAYFHFLVASEAKDWKWPLAFYYAQLVMRGVSRSQSISEYKQWYPRIQWRSP